MKKILNRFAKFQELGLEPYTHLDIQVYHDGSYNLVDNDCNELFDSGEATFNENEIVAKLDEIYKSISNFVELDFTVAGYKAKVTEAGVVVGCETISFETFDEIAKAVKQVRANKA